MLPLRKRHAIRLTYREVHQVEFAHTDMLVAIHALLTALDGDGEDGVGAGAVLIHVGRPHRPYQEVNTHWVQGVYGLSGTFPMQQTIAV